MRSWYPLFLLLTTAFTSYSQNKPNQTGALKIVGTIVDAQNEDPLEYATVTALKAQDSSFVGGTITESTGRYTLDLPAGSYLLKYEFIGFEKQWAGPFVLNPKTSPLKAQQLASAVSTSPAKRDSSPWT